VVPYLHNVIYRNPPQKYRSASFVVVCVCRPPGTVTSEFTEQLSDLLDRLATLDSRFIVVGDFNATGDWNGLNSRTADVITRHALRQHVRSLTHRDCNVIKRHRRRAERRYGRTGLPSDKRRTRRCAAQRGLGSWHNAPTTSTGRNCSKRRATSGPHSALQLMLHNRRLEMRVPRRQVQFVLRRQGETHPGQHRVGSTSVQPRMFAARPHAESELSDFQPVTIDEVWELLVSIPRKTSPVNVMPDSLLKDCTGHSRQFVTAERKVPSTLQIGAGAAATE